MGGQGSSRRSGGGGQGASTSGGAEAGPRSELRGWLHCRAQLAAQAADGLARAVCARPDATSQQDPLVLQLEEAAAVRAREEAEAAAAGAAAAAGGSTTTGRSPSPGPGGRPAPDSDAAQEAEYAAVEAAFMAALGLVQAAA